MHSLSLQTAQLFNLFDYSGRNLYAEYDVRTEQMTQLAGFARIEERGTELRISYEATQHFRLSM